MSPTLLEAVAAIVIVILGWQLGIALVPLILSRWRIARAQLDQLDQAATLDAGAAAQKERKHERATGIQQETGTDEQ